MHNVGFSPVPDFYMYWLIDCFHMLLLFEFFDLNWDEDPVQRLVFLSNRQVLLELSSAPPDA